MYYNCIQYNNVIIMICKIIEILTITMLVVWGVVVSAYARGRASPDGNGVGEED